jgi:hypothetical protein
MKIIIKALKSFTITTLKIIGKILLALIITSPIIYLSFKEAYTTRGYFAVGGEWILTIAIIGLILWSSEKISNKMSCNIYTNLSIKKKKEIEL